jgi:hypothetical protein
VLAAAAVLALVGWYSADRFSGGTAEATPAPQVTIITQCFNVTGGNDENEPLELYTDNFYDDSFTVRRAVRLCEIGTKDTGSGDPVGDTSVPAILLCYTITGGDDENTDVGLNTQNYGWDEVTVRSATMMCEPAQKNGFGELNLPTALCYNITGGNDPADFVELWTDNFSFDDVTVRRGIQMCESAYETAEETTTLPVSNGECFTITGGQDPNREVEMYTERFGYDTITVRAATLMCESASKTNLEIS